MTVPPLSSEASPRNFVEILQWINPLGTWQIAIYAFQASFMFFATMVNVASIFFQYRPDHYCAIEALADSSFTLNEIRNLSLPIVDDSGARNSCYHYALDYGQIKNVPYTQALEYVNTQLQQAGGNLSVVKCNEWVYDRSVMSNTVVTQWDLLCGREVYVAHGRTCYMIGFFIGALTAGPISDMLGRKPGMILFGSCLAIATIAIVFQKAIYGFLAFRFFQAVGGMGFYMCSFVYCLEITTPKFRDWIGGLYFVPYAIGYTALAPIAYLTKDWRNMHLVIAIPLLIIAPMAWLLPESPLWLLNGNKTKEAERVLDRAGSMNKRPLPPDVNLELIATAINKEAQSNSGSQLLEVRRHPLIICRTANLYFSWFVNALVYYGITWGITSFSGNIFINNAIAGAVELPAYLLCVPLLMWSRRYSVALMLFLAAFSLLATIPMTETGSGRLAVTMIGKFAITASFELVYVYTTELFPTLIRSTGLATSSMIGRIGSISAAYIVLLPEKAVRGSQERARLMNVPPAIFGSLALIAAGLTFFLPETKARTLPDTLEDAVEFRSKFEKYYIPLGIEQNCARLRI